MKKNIFIVLAVLATIGLGIGGYYLFSLWQNEGQPEEVNNIISGDTNEKQVVVRSEFYENFRDGKIDDFWKWNDGGRTDNSIGVDYVKEELTINVGPNTSQWTSDNSAPVLSFLTDQDFQMTVNFIFSPKVDFQHAGIGLFDSNDNNWIRMSRAYDSHALETDLDLADSLYVMDNDDIEGVKKYKHVNYIDSKVYMRMTKEGEVVTFEYSRDGIKWEKLDEVEKPELSRETNVYLFGYSTEKVPTKVIFKEIQFSVL
jgi:regulation of enolase protein 1 (concanavalin A-like superfamily)